MSNQVNEERNILEDFNNAAIERANSVIFTKFLSSYINNERRVYSFCEGIGDFTFYRPKIRAIFVHYDITIFNCEGKSNVYKLLEEVVEKEYDSSRTLFFVDKDFDDILEIPIIERDNLFTTKFYSIENYMVNDEILEIVLQEFHGVVDEIKIEEHQRRFNLLLNDFYQNIKEIIYTILTIRGQRLLNLYEEKYFNLTLSQGFDLGWFMKFDYGFDRIYMKEKVSDEEKIQYYKEVRRTLEVVNQVDKVSYSVLDKVVLENLVNIPEDYELDNSEMISKINAIENPKVYVRGKFETWFFCNYISSIITDGATTHTQITKENFETILGGKGTIPLELREFLTSNYQNSEHTFNN
jgi:hypothetical protein